MKSMADHQLTMNPVPSGFAHGGRTLDAHCSHGKQNHVSGVKIVP